jgi:hypothetical protein
MNSRPRQTSGEASCSPSSRIVVDHAFCRCTTFCGVISVNPVYRLFAYDLPGKSQSALLLAAAVSAAALTAATGDAVVAALEDVHALHRPKVPQASIAKNERERPDIEVS